MGGSRGEVAALGAPVEYNFAKIARRVSAAGSYGGSDPVGERLDGSASVHVGADGVVHVVWMPGTRITVALAEDAMREVDALNGARPAPLCVTMTEVGIPSRAAREVFSRPCSVSRVALVGRSTTDRLMATFSLGVSPSPVPRRFFTSTPEALAWLRQGECVA